MKALVLGANGMAGHVIVKYLKNNGIDVTTMARNHADHCFDIEVTRSVTDYFSRTENKYDFIINAIGLLVKDSIERPDRAALINSWFPHYLEHITAETDTKLIHLSTDCVFDGKSGPYLEDSFHTETNAYGKSKSYGEVNNSKDVTFRMSIIGPELKNGTGLMHWFMNNSDDKVSGYNDCFWNGITTLQLAKCILEHMNTPVITGVYHLVNNDVSISKYELLKLMNEIYKCNKTVVETSSPKPVNKILVDTRKLVDFKIPDYLQQLTEIMPYL